MTALAMSPAEHSGFGGFKRDRAETAQRGRGAAKARGETVVPPATPERPKSLLGRLVDAVTRPVDPTYHNP